MASRGICPANRPHMQQMVSQGTSKPMPDQRKRIGPLDTAGSVAIENAKVYKELRRGRIEPSRITLEPDPDQSTSDLGIMGRSETH